MNKDVLYIDVDDDITAIIGKVLASKDKIIALVPPKRTGVLQSAVNLRLLARTATAQDKRLVLITNNQALISLAAAAKIPVAKNLQSKPELATIAALDIDDGDDIIDGSQLPVGELEKTADTTEDLSDVGSSVDAIAREAKQPAATQKRTAANVKAAKAAKGKGGKVPNFNSFRKKLVFGIGGGLLLIGLLVWAIVFAPAATIVISAKTTPATINSTVALTTTASSDSSKSILRVSQQSVTKDASVEFEATGKETVGEKAKGQVVLRNCASNQPVTIAAGTAVSYNGKNYLTQSAVTAPAASGFRGCDAPGVSGPVSIVAQDIGDSYNVASGTAFAVAGQGETSGAYYFRAVASTEISGGSSKDVKVVTAADVQAAGEALVKQDDAAIKSQLSGQFTSGDKVVAESFVANRKAAVSTPAIGAEATGKAKLTSSVVYTMNAVPKTELEKFLETAMQGQMDDKTTQRVYKTGIDDVQFSNFIANEAGSTLQLRAKGQIGPKIDDAEIKNQVKGKKFGEIQSSLKSIDGVNDVDVKFSFFWVRTVPNNIDKIKIEFKLQND